MSGFRTIVINKRCKLESLFGTMVIRTQKEERINISEIETLIIETPAVAITSSLIIDLTEAGVNIIFCDRRHFPTTIFSPVHCHFSCAKNVGEQVLWSKELKSICWRLIISEKIKQQSQALQKINNLSDSKKLVDLIPLINNGDTDNIEAKAAKYYFVSMFGNDFTRNSSRIENNALNYGYTLILSSFVREIIACGYITEVGIWHKSNENPYNLASDLMEPFRVLVDLYVYNIPYSQEDNFKRYMQTLLTSTIEINGEKQSLIPAIRIYIHRIFRFLKGEVNDIHSFKIIQEDVDNEL